MSRGPSPRARRPSRARFVALHAGLLLLAGCGYSTRFALGPRYTSLGIELFGNSSLERDVERELHEALVRSAANLVDARLVPVPRAGLILRGEVLDYHRRSGIRSRENVQLETALTVRVRAELFDPAAGVVVAGPLTEATQVGFTLDRRSANESEARARVLANLAERLVLDLVAHVEAPPDERPPAVAPGGDGSGSPSPADSRKGGPGGVPPTRGG